MLMDRPCLFTRVAIVTKTKPRESLLSEAVLSSPPPTTTVPIPAINPFLTRMATTTPSASPHKNAKNAISSRKKVLAHDSSSEDSPSQEMQPIVGAKAHPASIVALDSSITISDQDIMKYINQAVNGAYVLARRSDHLAIDNSSLRHKAKGMEKAISFKTMLNRGLNEECKDLNSKLAQESRRVEELFKELAEERDAAKTWAVDKARLEAIGDDIQAEKEALQLRYVELERARAYDSIKALEALAQAKRDAETAFASMTVKAETDLPLGDSSIALFNKEKSWRPDWYRGLVLPLPEGTILLEEGGETPNLPVAEDTPANP
ncbi:hypothetical protein LIER_04062 [Lithospermum erythrorhizon]|uniref:Uncharacterized protein n=1 Tax=Lithospermum erythrorhizon TaxID=34254 RepID=A0AAV3NVG1_LITER